MEREAGKVLPNENNAPSSSSEVKAHSRINIFKGDKVIWMAFFFLCVISVVEVFSASSFLTYKGGNFMSPMMKHGGVLLLGLVCMIVTLNVKCKYFKVLTPWLLLISYACLIWVLIGGGVTNDAHRWMSFLGIHFQPSEIAKGVMVLTTAQILGNTQLEKSADPRDLKWILISCGPMIILIAPENLSTALLMALTLFMMMFIGRVPKRQLLALCGVVAAFAVAAVLCILIAGRDGNSAVVHSDENSDEEVLVEEHHKSGVFHRAHEWRNRILAFADNDKKEDPSKVDIENKGAQRVYSNIAIVSSNVHGVGPGKSEEREFLPQAFSDFIYAIIIEELGIGGAIIVAFLYIVLMFRTGRIASRCENNFPALLAMGLALMLTTQALFNMCVAVGLAPITGQPLPLISKGGTSTVINCIYIGVILSISRSAKRRDTPPETAPSSISSIPEE